MSQSFYNDLRKPRSARSSRSVHSARSGTGQPPTLINYQKREKLKQLLITKFMKKYNLRINEPFIEEEIKNFLHKETLSDNDLKKLDKKIFDLLQKKYSLNQLESNLKGEEEENKAYSNSGREGEDHLDKRSQTAFNRRNQDDNQSVRSVRSGLSGASKLSQAKPKKKDLTDEDLELLSVCSHRDPVERVQFASEKDEWNAINKYNQQVFQQDRINEKNKDMEIKRRTKEDLDNQIKQKMYFQNEERMKNREYDKIANDHVDLLNKMEAERKRELRQKMIREKENRDAQMLDEKKRKRLEELKNKKYEKELVTYIRHELDKEKKNAIQKKTQDNEALQRTLIQNEENKRIQAEIKEKERLEDLRFCEEYKQVLDKQENERKAYFKNIENKSNSFLARMSQTVLKDMDMKNKAEEERIKKYLQEKEERLLAKEKVKLEEVRQQKRDMRGFLDMQVEEKKKQRDFEKYLDNAQARVWNTDVDVLKEQNSIKRDKIKTMNDYNQQILKGQIGMKNARQSSTGMSDAEYLLNKELLEKAARNLSNNN